MPVTEEIERRIEAFKASMRDRGIEQTYADYVVSQGTSILGTEFEERLRAAIAEHFGVTLESVCIVGSAKLGFSPKAGQYFKHFSDDSDIDVAIVCRDLFARIWHEVAEMERAHEYYNFEKFKFYHFAGWIRPDRMPSSDEYVTSKDWWEFFRGLSGREEFLRFKIAAGLYHDHRFLKRYQLVSLLGLKEHIERDAA